MQNNLHWQKKRNEDLRRKLETYLATYDILRLEQDLKDKKKLIKRQQNAID